MEPRARPVTDPSATSARRGRESPPVFTELLPRGESWRRACEHCGERSSGARVRRHRATTSSSPAVSPRRSPPSARALPTCTPPAWPALGPSASASTRRPARCASPPTASSSPTGSSCSRRSSLRSLDLPPGRPKARCCSTTCERSWDPRWTGCLRRLLRGRIPRRQAAAVAHGGLRKRPSGQLERLCGVTPR
jgi:hypothetical protein